MVEKVIVAGSRGFDDYDFLSDKLDGLLRDMGGVEVVSGGALGADMLGERYALERDMMVARFVPEKYDAAAGPMKSKMMAEYADMLVAFNKKPNGTAGTNDMIRQMKKLGKTVVVFWF